MSTDNSAINNVMREKKNPYKENKKRILKEKLELDLKLNINRHKKLGLPIVKNPMEKHNNADES